MKRLPEIIAAYTTLDTVLEEQRNITESTAASRWASLQILNDQAYFLLCWGQLELEIDETCREAIRRRRSSPDWRLRRGWDLYNPEEKRLSGLSFEDRTLLVLDRLEGSGHAYARVMSHYSVRNRIAHGTLQSTRIDVSSFVRDCYVVQAALHRAA